MLYLNGVDGLLAKEEIAMSELIAKDQMMVAAH